MLLFVFVSQSHHTEWIIKDQVNVCLARVDIQVFQIHLELQTWVVGMKLYTK